MSNYSDLYNYYKEYTLTNTKYVLLSYDDFISLLDKSIVLEDTDGLLIGNINEDKAFITLLYGDKETKEKLIKNYEDIVKKTNIEKVYFHFFNPHLLRWNPLKNVEHPGYQGVILNSENHKLLNSLGYKDNSIQDTYYLDLSNYTVNNKYEELLEKNIKLEMSIEYYDSDKHSSLLTFTDELNHQGWKNAILKRGNMPLLVALSRNKIVGFTGPLKTEDSGRGYFAGIGVLESYRGHGLGKLLFYILCKEHKKLGSKYMTLFTGRNNYAKKIYLDNGFTVVESFMTLIKEL